MLLSVLSQLMQRQWNNLIQEKYINICKGKCDNLCRYIRKVTTPSKNIFVAIYVYNLFVGLHINCYELNIELAATHST